MTTTATAENTCPVCNDQLTPRWNCDKTCAQTWPEPFAVLHGHTDETSAYLVDDYPYGFRERTQIRYWIETKAKHGQRFVSQTLNPKTGKWNKPRTGTYQPIALMILDDQQHVTYTGLGLWASECELQRMERLLGDHATDYHRHAIKQQRLMNQASKYIKYEVTTRSHGDDKPRQTDDDVARIWSAALGQAARDLGV